MAERPQNGRNSMHTRSASQRSNFSIRSNPINIFSDDFALEPFDSASSSSSDTINANDSHDRVPDASSTSQTRLVNVPKPNAADEPSSIQRNGTRNSTSKRSFSQRHSASMAPARTQSTASHASLARTSSVSSNFSMPRPASPYNGATGPSHPYQMYPQVTRTSSISTVRPQEGAFVGSNGPEHPYAMYPQNTVPEEDVDEALPTTLIPVGFPGMARGYERQIGPEGEDVADIIGPDGHTEQLPPYTRYPDDIPRKAPIAAAVVDDLHLANSTGGSSREVPLSELTTLHEPSQMGDSSTVREETDSAGTAVSFKEKLRRNGGRRVCCGMPLWVVLCIVGMILFAGTIGGVIGGVVGAERGENHHRRPPSQSATSSAATTTVTTTSWIDATPLPSGTTLADIPLGTYNVPTSNVKSNSPDCVVDPQLKPAWGCMPPIGLGFTIEEAGSSSPTGKSITLEQYPISMNFSYGPQQPDLGGQQFPFSSFLDKDATDLGPSYFFYTEYTKVTILPEDAISSSSSKRSIRESELNERQAGYWGRKSTVLPGQKPWFCYWNNTVLEFFIYADQNITNTSSSSSSEHMSSSNPGGAAATTAAAMTSSGPALVAVTPTSSSPSSASTRTSNNARRDEGLEQRDLPQSNDYPTYPRYVKIEEKRKPYNNIPPTCQQMQVLYDGSWNPVGSVPIVTVEEVEPTATTSIAAAAATTGGTSAKFRRLASNIESQLQRLEERQTATLDSYCSCEWLSD